MSWVIGFAGAGAALSPDAALWLRIVGGVFGAILLMLAISETRTGLRSGRRRSSAGRVGASRTWRHWTAVGAALVAAAALFLGAAWFGQAREARDEVDQLSSAVAEEDQIAAELESQTAVIRDSISDLEEELNVVAGLRLQIEADVADLQSRRDAEALVLDEAIGGSREIASALIDMESVLNDLTVATAGISLELASLADTHAAGVANGNLRKLNSLFLAFDPTDLDGVWAQLEAVEASLSEAGALVEALRAVVGPNGEGG